VGRIRWLAIRLVHGVRSFYPSHPSSPSLTLSPSDSTGYGFHGDFGNGWDQELLQHVIDECDSTPDQLNGVIDACPLLTIQEIPEAQKCKTPALISEDIVGPMDNLPGENPIYQS